MNDTTVLCGSHIPLLTKIVEISRKPVLELGVGWSSTPLLHWICKAQGVNLISVESDREWLEKFRSFESDHHKLIHHDFNTPLDFGSGFGVVFVDHRPARKRRSSAQFYADKADFILLHDSELADHPSYKYTPIYGNFKYRYEYKSVGKPYTMILSNTKDVERILT